MSKIKMRKRRRGAAGFVMAVFFALGLSGSALAYGVAAPESVQSAKSQGMTLSRMSHSEGGFHAEIQIPRFQGMKNAQLQKKLNERNLDQGVETYRDFMEKIEEMKAEGEQFYGLGVNVTLVALTNRLLVLERSVTETMASSVTHVTCMNLDLRTGKILSLKDLFKNDSYIPLLSGLVRERMKEEMKRDEMRTYFIDDNEPGSFKAILPDQPFYILKDTLSLVFDQGSVGPYSMGVSTFTFPVSAFEDILARPELFRPDPEVPEEAQKKQS